MKRKTEMATLSMILQQIPQLARTVRVVESVTRHMRLLKNERKEN